MTKQSISSNFASVLGDIYPEIREYAISQYKEGEDLLHDALLIAMDKMRYNITPETLTSFLKITMQNLYKNTTRKVKCESLDKRNNIATYDKYFTDYPDDLVDSMPQKSKEVVALHIKGYLLKEISKLLAISMRTVSRRKRTGINKLKENIVYEEYFSNTGKKCYKIYKLEKYYNQYGKLKTYKIYLGKVSDAD